MCLNVKGTNQHEIKSEERDTQSHTCCFMSSNNHIGGVMVSVLASSTVDCGSNQRL